MARLKKIFTGRNRNNKSGVNLFSDVNDFTSDDIATDEGFTTFYNKYREDLFRYTHKGLPNEEVTFSILHDALIKVQNRAKKEKINNLKPYILKVIKNEKSDFYKKMANIRLIDIDTINERILDDEELDDYSNNLPTIYWTIRNLLNKKDMYFLLVEFKRLTIEDFAHLKLLEGQVLKDGNKSIKMKNKLPSINEFEQIRDSLTVFDVFDIEKSNKRNIRSRTIQALKKELSALKAKTKKLEKLNKLD